MEALLPGSNMSIYTLFEVDASGAEDIIRQTTGMFVSGKYALLKCFLLT